MKPVLQVRALCKTFGALEASRDVSLDVRPGEIHALIGPNGAGKSTLISQICGTLPPDSGSVHLMGEDVTHLSAAARARAGLARTFQISALAPDLTVLQNAMLGALGASGGSFRMAAPVMRDAALLVNASEALERVGLAGQRGTRVSNLSHAQRRLLEVAIALTLQPRIFLMDEPMAGLGADGSRALTALLSGLRSEAPILLVEHDMDAVFALADRISVLVYGRIIATGSPLQIRADTAVREAYLGEQTP